MVSGLGGAQAADQVRGPRKLFAIAAFVFVFGFACFAIIMISGIARGWRRAAALEHTSLVRSFVEVGAGGAAVVAPSMPARAPRRKRREAARSDDGPATTVNGNGPKTATTERSNGRSSGGRAASKGTGGQRSSVERTGGESERSAGERSDGEHGSGRPAGNKL